MKRLSGILLVILFLSSAYFLPAQNPLISYSGFPLKQNYSPLFGKDIIINNQPTENQQKVALCYAFNGWIYAAITYKGGAWGTKPACTVMKSEDNGISWTQVLDGNYDNGVFTSVDILVTGNSNTTLKVILAFVAKTTSEYGMGFVSRFDEQTGAWESSLFTSAFCYDIALSSDYMYPASNSNPSSIGILYSKNAFNGGGDSIIFRYSDNGGISCDHRRSIAGYSGRCHRVALAYGRSPSWDGGRYFGVWEVQDDFGDIPGHLYAAHTEPDITSPFTTPVMLDSLDPAYLNNCMNPSIACQYNDIDNDSTNLTEVILFEKFDPSTQKKDIRGFYNLQATNHTKFKKLFLSDSLHNNLQPDISFNPFDSTFMITYYDSIVQKLPFLINNFNLRNPTAWDIVSSGYNDSMNLSAPYPKVDVSSSIQTGANVWIANNPQGDGVAMFDAPSSTYTGISKINKTNESTLLGTYPNPCSKEIKIAFDLKKTMKICIELLTIWGQSLGTITDQTYIEGKHIVQYDVSYLPQGTYIYHFKSDDFTTFGKILLAR